MSQQDTKNYTKSEKKTMDRLKNSYLVTIIGDLIFLVIFIICLLVYSNLNTRSIFNQNIDNLTSLAESNSRLMQTVFDSIDDDVRKASKYCENKSLTEALDYLKMIANEDEEYQVVKEGDLSTEAYPKFYGFSTKIKDGSYIPVDYENSNLSVSLYKYASTNSSGVSYTQSFNNQTDGIRYFAVFSKVHLINDGLEEVYYILKPKRESTILDHAQRSLQYKDLSIAFCYTDGKYLAKDISFRGDNFYYYIYSYNSLTVDEKNALRDSVIADEDGVGYIQYKDFGKRDCIYAYASSGEADDWLFIVSVPESEFVQTQMISAFPLLIIIFLSILLLFNIYRLLIMVKQLRQSLKRELIANLSKSMFLSRMSHEIRTPLNAIIGYNILARNEIKDSSSEEERKQAQMKILNCLEKNEIASKHLLSIINDVLDISAIERGKIKIVSERFNLKGLINSLTTIFYTQARNKGVDFSVTLSNLSEEWFVGDQMRTNQILTNLLSNAVKFTPEGGSISMIVSQPELETNSGHLHFEIRDTGIGMSQEYLSHIWEPFEQADSSISRRFGGSGLGLSIVKNLVELMGGSISVSSQQSVGTTFCVDIVFEHTHQPENNTPYDFSKIYALVVDDDQSTCDYIRLLFDRCQVRCVAVTSGDQAIKAVQDSINQGTPFTVCLVDWKMPKMDGIQTIREIRKVAGNDLMILVLSAYDYTEIEKDANEIGIRQFISKPVFQSTLFDLLLNITGSHKIDAISENKHFDFDGTRILLVEDNEMNMEIAKRLLESVKLVVDTAWNGEEAVSKYQNSEPGTYAAILMDIHMPKMNGYEAAKAIRASDLSDSSSIPIIAMTADAFAENIAQAIEAGMNDHIAKPIDITKLFTSLRKFIKK